MPKVKSTRKPSKRSVSDRLLIATGRWVEAHGGRALVGGGISIETWPGDPDYCFYVRIKITGKKPTMTTDGARTH